MPMIPYPVGLQQYLIGEKNAPGPVASEQVDVWGFNPDVDNGATPETIWGPGGAFTWQTAVESLEVISTSAADTAAGAGARTVLVRGLDVNFAPIEASVALNGVAAVAVPGGAQWLRVNHFTVATAGGQNANAGVITLRVAGAGLTRRQIGLSVTGGFGDARDLSDIYTIPAGFSAVIAAVEFQLLGQSSMDSVDVDAVIRPNTVQTHFVLGDRLALNAVGSGIHQRILEHGTGFILPEKSDIEGRVTKATGLNLEVSHRFILYLFQQIMFVVP